MFFIEISARYFFILFLINKRNLLFLDTIWLLNSKNERRSFGPEDMIVLTGCDSGLGYSFALNCKKNSAAYVVAGVHSIDSPGAKELVKAGIHVYSLELTSSESVLSFANHIRNDLKNKNLSKIDIHYIH